MLQSFQLQGRKKTGTTKLELSIKNAGQHFLSQPRIPQSHKLQGSKRIKQRSWNYQERRGTFPMSVKNNTIPSTLRKTKNLTT